LEQLKLRSVSEGNEVRPPEQTGKGCTRLSSYTADVVYAVDSRVGQKNKM